MKNIYLIVFLITLSVAARAQANNINGKIAGKVIDAVTKQPVDYATVSIFKQDSTSLFNGMSTDSKGYDI